MSLEAALAAFTEALKENTAQQATATEALKENTAQHAAFAEIARAGVKAGTKSTATKAAPKGEPEEEPKKPAPTRKATTKESDPPELPTSVEAQELRGLARQFMAKDHENRDENKANFSAALKHLGAENLSAVSDADAPKLYGYITYWNAGLDVSFEEIDALVADSPSEEEEDLMG